MVQNRAECIRFDRRARRWSWRIGTAVGALLADGPHRAAAARLGASIRSAPGAAGGADALEAVLPGAAIHARDEGVLVT